MKILVTIFFIAASVALVLGASGLLYMMNRPAMSFITSLGTVSIILLTVAFALVAIFLSGINLAIQALIIQARRFRTK